MRRKSDNELSAVCEYQLDRQRYSNLELLEAIVEDVYNPSGVLDSPISPCWLLLTYMEPWPSLIEQRSCSP